MAPGIVWCSLVLSVALVAPAVQGLSHPAFVPTNSLHITKQSPAVSLRYDNSNACSVSPAWQRKTDELHCQRLTMNSHRGHPASKTALNLLPRLAALAVALHCAPRPAQASDFNFRPNTAPASETVAPASEVRSEAFMSPKVGFVTPQLATAQLADVQLGNPQWEGLVKTSGIQDKFLEVRDDLSDWFGYKLTQVLSSTELRLIAIASISTVLVVVGGWMLLLTGVGSWKEALFKSYALLNNAPGVSAVDEEDGKSAFAVNTIFFVGMLTFAVVIGIVTASIEEAVENVLAGDHRVVESGHIVMLNWNSKTVPMLKQIQAASAEGRVKKTAVVILSDREREEMEEELRDEFPEKKIQVFSALGKGFHPHIRLELQKVESGHDPPQPVTVVTRSGSPTSLPDLLRISAGRAKHVVIVPPEGDESLETLSLQTQCLDVLQRARQPTVKAGAGDKDLHVVVSDYDVDQAHTLPGLVLCPRNAFTERAIASALSQEGVMDVYNEILDQDTGHEIYLRPVKKMSWMAGKPFEEVVRHFRTSVALGWVDYSAGDGQVVMNPPGSALLPEKASVLVLAPEEASIHVSKRPHQAPHRLWSSSFSSMHSALSDKARNVLVLNFDGDTDPLEEIDESLPYGSTVCVLSPDKVELPKPKKVKMEHWVGDPFSLADMVEMDMSRFDSVVISAGGNSDQDGDTKVMGAANVVMKAKAISAPDTPPLRLITVFHNQAYWKILEKSFVDQGHLVEVTPVLSAKLEAGALIQILWHPDMRDVYQELLDPDGAQVVMVDGSFFAPLGERTSFGEIQDRAVQSGGVAMGIKHRDGPVKLCPSRGDKVSLGAGDKVVVLFDAANAKLAAKR